MRARELQIKVQGDGAQQTRVEIEKTKKTTDAYTKKIAKSNAARLVVEGEREQQKKHIVELEAQLAEVRMLSTWWLLLWWWLLL